MFIVTIDLTLKYYFKKAEKSSLISFIIIKSSPSSWSPHGMEIQRARRPPPPPPPAVAAVLGDDDLLREIFLRLGLLTSLLRAALACKHWYRAASDPAFLRRFRHRHPPRVLGAYLNFSGISLPRSARSQSSPPRRATRAPSSPPRSSAAAASSSRPPRSTMAT
jgi:hypothetical protein